MDKHNKNYKTIITHHLYTNANAFLAMADFNLSLHADIKCAAVPNTLAEVVEHGNCLVP